MKDGDKLQVVTPVRFSKNGLRDLDKLVKFTGLNRSDVIRQAIHNQYEELKAAGVIK